MQAPLESSKGHSRLHTEFLPEMMRERLQQRGLKGTRRISFEDDPLPGVTYVGRVHPIVAVLAETLAEGALDPAGADGKALGRAGVWRSEEHTSELQSLMRISYAVFCLKKKNKDNQNDREPY